VSSIGTIGLLGANILASDCTSRAGWVNNEGCFSVAGTNHPFAPGGEVGRNSTFSRVSGRKVYRGSLRIGRCVAEMHGRQLAV